MPANDESGNGHGDQRALIDAARRQVSAARADDGGGQFAAPPDSFPGYHLIREIHRGGQGVVYQALQESTKRKVAVKVLREGPLAEPRERMRFEREVAILGSLSHPGLVAIHDSGQAAGHFFYVMDYIRGQPLDVYMASGERTVRETMELFAKVCDAVNAAHLKGVIHRDLKPRNILIDADGQPHVVDFGLAKVGGAASEQFVTVTGQFVGSLPWASPEQAEGRTEQLDIRTDVYSLGVILYELLTDALPYDVSGVVLPDAVRMICESPPRRPSMVFRTGNRLKMSSGIDRSARFSGA